MAQNIELLGATYPDVPAVQLPKSGGGSALFSDVSDTTAAAADVVSGEVFYTASGSRSLGTASYAGSATPGGAATMTAAIPYGECDSTSTATAFTATVPGISALDDGVCMLLKNGVVTSAANFTININGLGAKPAYNNLATGNDITPTAPTRETTIFNVNYTMLWVYSTEIVDGGGWICYRGYDSNTNTIGYQLRTNSTLRKAADKGYRYRLWFKTLDGKYAPANTSSSTNATSSRTPNTRIIDPFGEIIYNATNGTTEANANLSATNCWQQYVLSLGYSFNSTGAALVLTYPAPVYVQCTPQAAGGVKMNGYTQTLPSSADGKVYIYLGMAYNATNIELVPYHPVYYYSNGAIRLWSNAESGGGGSTVSVTQSLTSGTQVGTITVDGTGTNLYAPKPPTVTTATVTIGASEWTSILHTATKAVSGVTSTNVVVISPDFNSYDEYTKCGIDARSQSTGYLVFYWHTEKPTNPVTVNVLIIDP